MIDTFDNFTQPKKRSDSAGIAIVYTPADTQKPMILLVHPTNSSWVKPTMGIPKGKMEDGESPEEAAFRETFEETGLRIRHDQVEPAIQTAEVWSGTKFKNNIHYLVCRISDLSEIGLTSLRVPKEQLQLEELDWAGFMDVEEAYTHVSASQRIILDRLR
jgi:8-oxo-dGTP pyrophosphatase MutT (NUDIX family)